MGTLYVVSTPIGNLEDITIRAIKTLFSVDIIACEDTRRTGILIEKLRQRYESTLLSGAKLLRPKLVRFDDLTEKQLTPLLVAEVASDKNVALVSDAGTPLISDPGYFLVSQAAKRGARIVSVPGSSAILASLTSSGLAVDKFTFLGYPPEKKAHRLKLFTNLRSLSQVLPSTYVFYIAPHKLKHTLLEMEETLGEAQIAICRELTKVYEDSWVGTISEARDHFQTVKGEVVLLVRL